MTATAPESRRLSGRFLFLKIRGDVGSCAEYESRTRTRMNLLKIWGRRPSDSGLRRPETAFYSRLIPSGSSTAWRIRSRRRPFTTQTARKLLEFPEALERDNYIQAVAREYFINYEDLKRLVNQMGSRYGTALPGTQAARETGISGEIYGEKPKTFQKKKDQGGGNPPVGETSAHLADRGSAGCLTRFRGS